MSRGNWASSRASEEERALDDVVLLQLPVLPDQFDVEEGQDEDAREESNATGNTKDGTDGRCSSPVVKVEGCSALPDDEHGQDSGCQSVEDRNHDHAHLERVLRLHHTVLGEEEEDGTESSRDTRGNGPGGENLGNTTPGPVDTVGSDGSEANTDDTADDAVGCRDWKTDPCCESQEERGANERAKHAHHEDAWCVDEGIDGNDIVFDGTGDTGSVKV